MNRRALHFAVRVFAGLALLAGASAFGQGPLDVHFSGVLNDYSPSTVKGGPWEMHGTWSLDVHGATGAADFSAAMTMSGYGKTATGAVDPTQGGQSAHTHNIQLTNLKIIWNMTGCPGYSPATLQGFQIQGTVSQLTGNGSNAAFETNPPSSVLQVCVSGGDFIPNSVPFSNMTMVFTGPATTHFGTQAIHGDVRSVELLGGPR
jgi:hypothetical protein